MKLYEHTSICTTKTMDQYLPIGVMDYEIYEITDVDCKRDIVWIELLKKTHTGKNKFYGIVHSIKGLSMICAGSLESGSAKHYLLVSERRCFYFLADNKGRPFYKQLIL